MFSHARLLNHGQEPQVGIESASQSNDRYREFEDNIRQVLSERGIYPDNGSSDYARGFTNQDIISLHLIQLSGLIEQGFISHSLMNDRQHTVWLGILDEIDPRTNALITRPTVLWYVDGFNEEGKPTITREEQVPLPKPRLPNMNGRRTQPISLVRRYKGVTGFGEFDGEPSQAEIRTPSSRKTHSGLQEEVETIYGDPIIHNPKDGSPTYILGGPYITFLSLCHAIREGSISPDEMHKILLTIHGEFNWLE